jgi:uncharacterized protein (TIGR02391 family)
LALRKMVETIAQDRRRKREAAKAETVGERAGVETETWHKTIKGPEGKSVKSLLELVTSDEVDMSDDAVSRIVDDVRSIAPPYADMFWRNLHETVQAAAREPYEQGRYVDAVTEAYKAFIALTRDLSGIKEGTDADLLGKAYGIQSTSVLKVLSQFDTNRLSQNSIASMENGQRELAKGVGQAFRNPLSHEPATTIQKIGLFTYQDCLDALSIISHLCRRASGCAPVVQSEKA